MTVGGNKASAGEINKSIYARCGIPCIFAPTGTVGVNGALTFGTAMQNIYADAFVVLPANALFAGSTLGVYYAKMTSTTVGTVFKNQYLPGAPPVIPDVTIPVTGNGGGAYTGVTGVGPNVLSLTLPVNTLTDSAVIQIMSLWSVFNSAGSKSCRILVGGNLVYNIAQTTNQALMGVTQLYVRGNPGVSMAGFTATNAQGSGAAAGQTNVFAIDLTTPQTITMNANIVVATDYAVLEGYTVEVFN
jgi:hypothetical protein